ncbi:hypothetical protein H0H93_002065 [Arthromyces matolae]|nr:hypothetical protein H0H93_002065 [Arthromyces matolae]
MAMVKAVLNRVPWGIYRIPAIISSICVTITAFSIFIWALAKQGNGGPLFSNPEAIYGIGKLSPGSVLGWVMMRCITSGIGGWAGGVSLPLSIYRAKILNYWINFLSHTDLIPERCVTNVDRSDSALNLPTKTSRAMPSIQGIRYGGRFLLYPSVCLGQMFLASSQPLRPADSTQTKGFSGIHFFSSQRN